MGLYNLKNIEFYGNYKTYKTINEIIKEQKVFELCLEENDYYLTSDAFNKIELYSKENKKLEDICHCIDPFCNKYILSFNELSNDKIYITFNKIADNDNNITKGARSPICLVI